jgi:hypothetical protein
MKTNDVLDLLKMELGTITEMDPPAGMWERFAARLEAEPVEAEEASPVTQKVTLRGLALVPTR